jgi:hypothetical protein
MKRSVWRKLNGSRGLMSMVKGSADPACSSQAPPLRSAARLSFCNGCPRPGNRTFPLTFYKSGVHSCRVSRSGQS